MNKRELRKAMKDTCFKSLAYCCGLEKPCPKRDGVMKRIGLLKKEYVWHKEKIFDGVLLFHLKCKEENESKP